MFFFGDVNRLLHCGFCASRMDTVISHLREDPESWYSATLEFWPKWFWELLVDHDISERKRKKKVVSLLGWSWNIRNRWYTRPEQVVRVWRRPEAPKSISELRIMSFFNIFNELYSKVQFKVRFVLLYFSLANILKNHEKSRKEQLKLQDRAETLWTCRTHEYYIS